MPVADFFDLTPEAASARVELTLDVMRDLSRATDPQAMYQVYSSRMREIFPTTRQISLSRRGLAAPQLRITRFNLWNDPVNPCRRGAPAAPRPRAVQRAGPRRSPAGH